jgi:hypothetical protein
MPELVEASRLSICLPVNTPEEQFAAASVTAFVRERFSGLTVSRLDEAAFRGHWYDRESGILYEDAIAVLQTDLPGDQYPRHQADEFAEEIRQSADKA